ncbi:MAG: hypothetical protein ACOH1Y_01260 [Propionicimonas sp.]
MLTTSQAAALVGLPKEQFRSAMSKERKNGKEFHVDRDKWLDARTPLWNEKKVLAWAKARKKRKKREKHAKDSD